MNQSTLGTAVITGASTGIGALYAERLAARGYDLLLVARNGARLLELAARLQADTGRTVRSISADLTDAQDLARIETLLREDSSISMLVNNAGVGATAPLLASDVGKMAQMIALNVTALTRLTYAAAPRFVARGQGTIINIASIVAIAPRSPERGLWCQQGLRGGPEPVAPARTGRPGCVRASGTAGRDRDRLLERRRHPGRALAARNRHARGCHGRRGVGRTGPR